MTQINSQCSLCQHFRVFNREADTCAAYPTGIPRRILENKLDHRRPIAGDRGIRWKFNPENPECKDKTGGVFKRLFEEGLIYRVPLTPRQGPGPRGNL